MTDAPTYNARPAEVGRNPQAFVTEEGALSELAALLGPVLQRLVDRGVLHPHYRAQDGERLFSIEELHARRGEILFVVGLPATD